MQRPDGVLDFVSSANAVQPSAEQGRPLLVMDVWEHACYVDYRHARPR